MGLGRIKQGDTVKVTTGLCRGDIGVITAKKMFKDNQVRVCVSGLKKIIKHEKPKSGKEGKRVGRDRWIHSSNVMLYDEDSKKTSRVGFIFKEGKKMRIFRSSGELVD